MIVAKGAEAIISRENESLVKERISKDYRHPKIDNMLRLERTRKEAKLLQRALQLGIPVPRVLSVNEKEMTIIMEEIKGSKLKDLIDSKKNVDDIFKLLGKSVSLLHQNEIIHGDLTTSNIIVKDGVPFLIDFGLGMFSSRIEDMAMDIVLLRDVIRSSHPDFEFWTFFETGYSTFPHFQLVMKRLDKIESRGRYMTKN